MKNCSAYTALGIWKELEVHLGKRHGNIYITKGVCWRNPNPRQFFISSEKRERDELQQ
ncbi:hypothetical protein T4E_2776, partial [Trichinella pseudospiralis]